jgi:hypothetical protein
MAPELIQQSLKLTENSQFDIELVEGLRRFQEFGSETIVESLDGIDYYINEFWTSRQRQANRLHEVSFRACFNRNYRVFLLIG